MRFLNSKTFIGLTMITAATFSGCSSSETTPMMKDRSLATSKYNDAQEEQGTVQRFLINARGELEGMILEGGTQVSFTPVMAARVKKLIAVNDVVLVKGFYENDRVFTAEDITNMKTARRISAQLSPPPVPLQDDLPNYLAPEGTRSRITKTPVSKHQGLNKFSAEGTIQTRLYGKFGELTGVVLSDGTIVHFKPEIINTIDLNADIGDKLKASGYGTQNNFGRSIDATEVIRE